MLHGGSSKRALKWVAEHADGWYGAIGVPTDDDVQWVARVRSDLGRFARALGRDEGELVMALRIAVSARGFSEEQLARRLSALARAGVTEFTIDFGWKNVDQGRLVLERLRRTVRSVGWVI